MDSESAVSAGPNCARVVRRHREYYFKEADIVFRVEDVLFRVHRYFFTRESPYFRFKLPHPGGEGTSDSNPLVLEDTLAIDFECFLWVFYNPKFSIYDATIDNWISILKLSGRWGFAEVKALAVRKLEELQIPPLQKIVTYRTYSVNPSLLQGAYAALTLRDEPLTIEEGRQLGLETALKISHARQIMRTPDLRGRKLTDHRDNTYALLRETFQLSFPDVGVEDASSALKEKEDQGPAPPRPPPPCAFFSSYESICAYNHALQTSVSNPIRHHRSPQYPLQIGTRSSPSALMTKVKIRQGQ
ncbi:hypothetical protein BGW80DRAFT_1168205 [Lactifluus volemus]|nr:hypothetical protein BGW80DRAFT_1168205 [Lactifluus volemus]